MAKLPGSASDPLWYKDAIIYELRTGSFYDSDDDGVGDLRGLRVFYVCHGGLPRHTLA